MKKFIFIFMFFCTNVFASNNVMDKSTITPVPADDYLYIVDGGTADGKATISSVMTSSESVLEGVLDLQDLQGAVTDAQVPNDITVNAATTASTATALAANGSNCSAGSYPLGVDASGAVESCTDATTEINSAISAAASNYESATSNDFDPDRLAGDTVDDNKVDAGIIADLSATYQSADVDLTIYAGITPSANVQSLLGAATYAAMRTLLDLEAGTDFYSKSAEDTWRNSVTQTEMGYLNGVTSDIQTQLGGKQATLTNSAGLRGALSDESGTGAAIFAGGNIGAGTATTPAENDNDTSIATTAYVQGEINGAGGTNLSCSGGQCNVDDVFALHAGDTYTGTHDFSGGVVTLPSTAGMGTGIITPWETINKTIIDPDSIQSTEDAVPLFYVSASAYPNGKTNASTAGAATGIRMFADQANSGSVGLEVWTGTGPVFSSTITTVTFGSTTGAAPQAPLSVSTISAGDWIFGNLDDTDLNWLEIIIPYTKD